jgi:hypothetical protein
MEWLETLLRIVVGFGAGWLLGWLLIRGVRWCRKRWEAEPSGAGKRTPIEDLVSYKAMERERHGTAWMDEWVACLSVEERAEIDALYEEWLYESGRHVPYDIQHTVRRDSLRSEVQNRIKHLAAGRPDLIRRPKPRSMEEAALHMVRKQSEPDSGPVSYAIKKANGEVEYYIPEPPKGPSAVRPPKVSDHEAVLLRQAEDLRVITALQKNAPAYVYTEQERKDALMQDAVNSVIPQRWMMDGLYADSEDVARRLAADLAWNQKARRRAQMFDKGM